MLIKFTCLWYLWVGKDPKSSAKIVILVERTYVRKYVIEHKTYSFLPNAP